MLCPKCGIDVGREINLCGECLDELAEPEEEAAALEEDQEPEAGEEEEEEEREEAGAQEAEAELETEEPEPASVRRKPAVEGQASEKKLLYIGLALLVPVILLLVWQNVGPSAPDESREPAVNGDPQTGEDAETVEGQPIGPDNAELQPELEEPRVPTAPTITSGSITAEDIIVAPRDSLALYFPLEQKLEVGFFRTELTEAQRESALDASSLEQLDGAKPDFLVTLWLQRGTAFCGPPSVPRYTVRLLESPGGFNRPAGFDFAGEGSAIAEFTCRLEHGAPLTLQLARSTTLKTRTEQRVYQWETRSAGPVYVSSSPAQVSYSSLEARPVALWNKETRELKLGFYEKPVTREERLQIRSKQSLFALEEKRPPLTVSFEVNNNFTTFEQNSLRGYGVHFHRSPVNDGTGISFPGEEDTVSLYFVVTTRKSEELTRLAGNLFEGDIIRGAMKNSQVKEFEQGNIEFSWELDFASQIVDQFSEPMASIEAVELSMPREKSPPTGIEGVIEAGGARAELKDAVALWYPLEYDLVIGFYQDKLSEAERAKIIANKSVWSSVNYKLPSFVFIFDLQQGRTKFRKENLASFSLSFVRDKLGEFYFSGRLNRATIKRLPAEIKAGDLSFFAGEEGGEVLVRSKGDYTSRRNNNLFFTWDISAKAPVVEIR